METKDWILLIIPIVLEGLLIFILQKRFEVKYTKRLQQLSRKNETLLDFQRHICSALILLQKLSYPLPQAETNRIISGFFSLLNNEIVVCFESHRGILGPYSANMDEVKEYGNRLITALQQLKIEDANKYINKMRAAMQALSTKIDTALAGQKPPR